MKKRSSVVAIKTVTSRPVLFLWSITSILVTFLCCWSYSQPAWTLRSSSEIGSLDQLADQQPGRKVRIERAVSIQLPAEEFIIEDDVNNSSTVLIPGRSAIPLVHIGLFGMCIYTTQQPERRPTVTCVGHADLDYEWLPPAWQVIKMNGLLIS